MKNFIKDNKDITILAIVSIVAFIVGFLAVGPLLALIVVGIADVLFFLPELLKKSNNKKKLENKGLKTNKGEAKKNPKTIKKKKKGKKIFKILLILFFLCCIVVIIAGSIFMFYIVSNAPKFDPEKLYRKEATIIYDASGNEIATIGSEKREIL